MVRRTWLGVVLLMLSLKAMAIDAVISHSVFYIPDSLHAANSQPYLELYWQVNPQSLHYMRTAQQTIMARMKVDISVTGDSSVLKHSVFIYETPQYKDGNDAVAHSIIDLRRFALPAGHINVKVVFTDITDSSNRFRYSDTLTIQPPTQSAFYSDIELIDTLYPSAEQTIFQRNNNQQIPFCTNFYDTTRNVLHYYSELYGTQEVPADELPLIQRVFISKNGEVGIYPKLVKIDTIKPRQVAIATGVFNISSLPSGNYYVNTRLENSLHTVLCSKALFFQRFNENPAPPDTTTATKTAEVTKTLENVNILDLNNTFLAKYSQDQIKAILKMMLPISDPADVQTIKNFLKSPDDMYMRYFIYNYFAAINKKDPTKAWKSFTDRIKEVNKMFNSSGTPGYTTERGAVYLRYGKPTEIITMENEPGSYPYEIWQYNSLDMMNGKSISNAVFLFYRPSEMIFDYQLLHSNVPGEMQNKNWRSVLYVNGSTTGGQNSRAEQIIGNAH